MSYVPDFAPDTDSQWRAIDFRFQEIALDLLEDVCASPPRRVDHVADTVIEDDEFRHFVFLHVTIDHLRQTVTVVGAGHLARRRP